MALDDLGHDRQSETRAAGLTSARRVRTNEALKESAALADVDALAVVGDRDDRLGPVVVRIEFQFFRGVARGVVDDVADHALHHRRVAGDARRSHLRRVHAEFTEQSHALPLFEEQVVEVDIDTLDLGAQFIVAGEPREVVDQGFETTALAHNDLAHLVPIGAFGILRGPFGRREQRGERAAQFVAGVGDELLLELG